MRIRVWALLFSLLVLGGGVSAQPLDGQCQSSSGAGISIQTGKIYVNAVGANGTRYTGEGRWLDATSFRYGIQGFQDEWVGTFLTDGRIKVIATKSNSKVTYWTKQR